MVDGGIALRLLLLIWDCIALRLLWLRVSSEGVATVCWEAVVPLVWVVAVDAPGEAVRGHFGW